MKNYILSIIRHGMTDANEKGVYIGTTDIPLNNKGAAELAAKMDEYDYPSVQKVYTSPLLRCTETAEILFPEIETEKLEDLRELYLGDFENKQVDELVGRDDFKAWLRGGRDSRPPNGESLNEMTARIYTSLHVMFMDMMQNGITHSAVITHGGIITNMLMGFGIPKYDQEYLKCNPGEGFDVMTTAAMWMNAQAFEILSRCPYEHIDEESRYYE